MNAKFDVVSKGQFSPVAAAAERRRRRAERVYFVLKVVERTRGYALMLEAAFLCAPVLCTVKTTLFW